MSSRHLPKYKVVDPEPSYGFVMRNVRFSEYLGLATATAGVYAYFSVQGRFRSPRYAAVMAGMFCTTYTFCIHSCEILFVYIVFQFSYLLS